MSARNDASAPAQTIGELHSINPLIDENGDTAPIQAVLSLATFMLLNSDDEGEIHLPGGAAFGLACLLDTCGAALAHMQGMEVQKST